MGLAVILGNYSANHHLECPDGQKWKKMNKKMVIKIFSYNFLYIFLKFLAVGDYLCYSLNRYNLRKEN